MYVGVSKPAPESSATSPATPPSSALSTHSSACAVVSTPLATDEIKAEIEADISGCSQQSERFGDFFWSYDSESETSS